MNDRALFIAALSWEAQTILSHLSVVHTESGPWGSFWRGSSGGSTVAVLKCGMGPQRALTALRQAVVLSAPRTIVSAGCAGALSPLLDVGDLVIGDEVRSYEGDVWKSNPVWVDRYREAASAARVRTQVGRLLTSPAVLAGAEAKRRAGEETGALAVEMEGATIARWAAEAGVEFVAARVILDTVAMTLPDMTTLVGAGGRPRPLPLLMTVLRRPPVIFQFIALRSAMKRCRAALSALHRELLKM